MYIKKVQLDNYGKFHKKTICFSPGLNVVYGENESGKSTLHSFLTGMLFGMERPRGRGAKEGANWAYYRYEPWNSASYYSGSMEFCVAGQDHTGKAGEKSFTLERNFYHKERTARLYNRNDGEELSVEHGDLEILLGGMNRRIYENTCCIPQAAVVTENAFAKELQQELVNMMHGGENGTDAAQAEKLLERRLHRTEARQKELCRQKQQQLERLAWEQELLEEEVQSLTQKLAVYAKEREMPREDRNTGKGFFWKLPILGWLLRLLKRIRDSLRKKCGKQPKEGDTSAAWEVLQEQLEEKRVRLFNLEDEIRENSGKSADEQEVQTELKSIQLALDTMERILRDSCQEDREELLNAVEQIFSEITGGAYEDLEVTGDGRVRIHCEEKSLEPWQLSRGTMEQLYFSLRLGMGRCFMQEERLPVLLDETFCAYDELRLKRTLRWLAGQPWQTILFTSQKRELTLLDHMGVEYQQILL